MFNNLNSTLKKVVVIFLIITLTYANLVLIGSNIVEGLISYAAEEAENEEKTEVVANQELVMNNDIDETKKVIQVAIETGIESEEYPIKESTIKLRTDIIEGTLVDVKVTELNKNSYTSGTWKISDEEENKLVIFLVNENETLETKNNGLDKFLVTYVYENEVGDADEDAEVEETIKQPLEKVEVKTFADETLTNVCEEANFENIEIEKELLLLNIENKDIHKTTIVDEYVEYSENLNLDLSYRKDASTITVEDTENKFYNSDDEIDEEISLKYKTTTINKEDLISLLGDDGVLTVTDTATSKILIELKKEDLATVQSVKQYYTEEGIKAANGTEETELRSELTVTEKDVIINYSIDVTKLKLDIINIVEQSENKIELSNFVITNTKSFLNNTNLENLNYLKEEIKYVIEYEADETETAEKIEKTAKSTIKFKDTITKASLAVDDAEWEVGQANTVKYTITLDTTTEKSELFVNPMFLLELPTSVESVNKENSEFKVNNDNGAFTSKRVFITSVLGKKFAVITLEGAQTEETIKNGDTTIDLTLELNVVESETEGNETTKLYYQNNTVTAYESGKGFDTAEVTVEMVMASEPKDEIEETVTPEDGEEGTEPEENEDFLLTLTSTAQNVIKAGDEFRYDVDIINTTQDEKHNIKLASTLPEGISIVNVLDSEIVNGERVELAYDFNESTREFMISVERLIGAAPGIKNFEGAEERDYAHYGSKSIQIIVKADKLQEDVFIKNIKYSIDLVEGEIVLAKSDEVVNTISSPFIEVEIDEIPERINELEKFVLGVKVTNKGLISSAGVNINIEIPKEISISKYKTSVLTNNEQEQIMDEGTITGDFKKMNFIISASETYYFQITGKVNEIDETKQVTIKGTLDDEEFSWTTELVNATENPDDGSEEPSNPNDPTKPQDPTNPDKPADPEKPTTPDDNNDSENPGDKENKKEEFDLSLNQYLNKVTVTNAKGTTTYNYKDTNFAKVEIHSKQMNGSKVTLEYKIIVKNEGTIPGYARKIVDYLPKGLTFNEEQNKDWYVGEDGNIYSIKLIEKLLNPGETAELTVVLEKQMTNENIGTITNLVEIYEASNEEDVEDINSIPGDKIDGQNDMSKVEVMVVTSTGTIILYTTLALAVITIIAVGFYRVKKLTLNKKGGC